MSPEKEKYTTVQIIAERLSCTDNYVYSLIRDGRLKAVKIGERALRIAESSYDKFLAGNAVDPADYFGPADEAQQHKKNHHQGTARSAWMSK